MENYIVLLAGHQIIRVTNVSEIVHNNRDEDINLVDFYREKDGKDVLQASFNMNTIMGYCIDNRTDLISVDMTPEQWEIARKAIGLNQDGSVNHSQEQEPAVQ